MWKDVAIFYQYILCTLDMPPWSLHLYAWHVSDAPHFLWGGSYTEYKTTQTLKKGVCGEVLFQQRHN